MPQRICSGKAPLLQANSKRISKKNIKLSLDGSNNDRLKVSAPISVVNKVKKCGIDDKWKAPSKKMGHLEFGRDKVSENTIIVKEENVTQMYYNNVPSNSVDIPSEPTLIQPKLPAYSTGTPMDKVIVYTISQANKIKDKQFSQKINDTTTGSHNKYISTVKDSKNFQSHVTLVNANQSTTQNELFRERSIEETEAAHDLLSLSQSLPPLPAPCVVTILNPDQNYDPNVNEISTSYVTYNNQNNTRSTIEIHYKIDKVNESTSHSNHPQLSYSDDNNQSRENVSPLTPPASESSSDTEQSSSYSSEFSNSAKSVKRKSKNSKSNRNDDGKVYAMTIFDSVMINDGRTKKGNNNGEAEIIHVEEKRQGRYKCPQCGKQYATSSNLSRHKQTHRSLDSQSAKKCHTCGKAYVSMPALAMHLLTHKLTHSCGVCGKLFSRPWLLQGHLRSHSGEKPYACAHCGKSFADRSNLRAHMQTHSINKQYECTRCAKTFALKSYLNKHLESSCLRDEFKKCFEDGEVQRIEDDDNFDEDEDIIVT